MNSIPFDCSDDLALFYRKLPYQTGGAMLPSGQFYFAGSRRQRGAGLGGIFGTIARAIIPFAKKYILPNAINAVQNIAADVTNGRNLKDAIKINSVSALKTMGRQYLSQTGSGKRARKRSAGKTKTQKACQFKRKKIAIKKKPKRKNKKTSRKSKGRKRKVEVLPSIFH
jgi:hypothetical protein